MIESKLAFFKMQVKGIFGESSKFCESHFSDSPKVFDAVNMGIAISEFVVSMLNPIVFFITQVDQAVVAFPSVRMDRAFKVDFTLDSRF